MRTPARSSSIVIFGVLVAMAGACQKSGDALLYVTVTASPTLRGVDRVDVIVMKVADAGPRTAGPLHYPGPDGGVDIGAVGETLTVVVPGSTGPVTLTVVARGAGGLELARGSSSPVSPHAGSITNVTVMLGSSGIPDGGSSDDATEDSAEPSGAGGSATGSGGIGGNGGAGNGGAGQAGADAGAGAGGTGGGAGGGGATGTGGAAGGCVAGNSMACNTGALGICATGVKSCTSGVWGSCVQSVAKGTRDCTSGNDNDCNGQPDNAETTYCQCSLVNSPRACSTGLNGICMAGTQACVVSGDKSTSAWGGCTQVKTKGTETCANPGTDDDCDGVLDNVPTSPCNVGNGMGACLNGGYTGCNGTTPVCNPAVSAIGDPISNVWHINPAPNGSWDWNCDGVVSKQYPDQAPAPPTCTGLSMSACSSVPQLYYALNPFACGDQGDIGSEYCIWLAAIPGCTNKSGQSTGFQQGCR